MRRRAEFQWFLTLLSERPGKCFPISDQEFPYRLCISMKVSSSSAVQSPFFTFGSKWFSHRSRHLRRRALLVSLGVRYHPKLSERLSGAALRSLARAGTAEVAGGGALFAVAVGHVAGHHGPLDLVDALLPDQVLELPVLICRPQPLARHARRLPRAPFDHRPSLGPLGPLGGGLGRRRAAGRERLALRLFGSGRAMVSPLLGCAAGGLR